MIKVTAFITLLVFVFSCSTSTSGDDTNKITTGTRKEAADFSFTTVTGETHTLSDYKGKVVYIFFLGSFCPICIGNAPGTVTVDKKYDDSEVQVLGLDVWDGTGSQVLAFIGSTGVEYPVLQNASSTQSKYGVRYDYSVLIDKQGRVAYTEEGVNATEISLNIDALLAE